MSYPEIDPVGTDSLQEITSQGTIMVHGFVPLDLLEQRKENVGYLQPEERAIGMQSLTATALTVKSGEIVVADKKNQRLSEAKTAHAVSVFTSFAGIKFPVRRTQKKFNRQFAVIGFAAVRADASGIIPPTSGISIRKGGSGTTINSSGVVLMPGDVFGARLPSLDESKRSLQYASEGYRKAPQSFSQSGKYTATVKKITYKDIIGEFHEIAEHLLVNNTRINIPEWTRRLPSGDGLTDSDREAMCLKKYNAAAFLSGVQAVLESGLVVPTASTTEVGRLLSVWEEAANPIDPNTDEAIYKHRWVPYPSDDAKILAVLAAVGAAAAADKVATLKTALRSRDWNGHFERITESAELVDRKSSYQRAISILAAKFGIASLNDSPVTEDFNLTLSANTRLLIGSTGEVLGEYREKLVGFVEKDLEKNQSEERDSFGVSHTTLNSTSDQIFKVFNEAGTEWVKLCGRSFDNAMRHAMGTVLNYSRPNGALHYSLT